MLMLIQRVILSETCLDPKVDVVVVRPFGDCISGSSVRSEGSNHSGGEVPLSNKIS